VTTSARSVRLASIVYGGEGETRDHAEDYHEASSLYPASAAHQMRGGTRLRRSPKLAQSVTRAVRRRPEAPFTDMPEPDALAVPLGAVLRTRRSTRAFADRPIELRALSTVLASACAPTHDLDDDGIVHRLRAAPSAGALFPLDLYACILAVRDIEGGIHHYDPFRHVLARLPFPVDREAVGSALLQDDVANAAACVILLVATFARSRFKYGQRGYRFTLLEAGHVAQNILLAAEALEIAAVPVGGFFDRRMSSLVGADGVHEAVVYAAAVGSAG
jgi:SagB-type dehydrogenase family enzyme